MGLGPYRLSLNQRLEDYLGGTSHGGFSGCYWCERSRRAVRQGPDYRATGELITLARDMLALIRPVLRLPPVAKLLARLAHAFEPVFGSSSK